MIRRSFHKHDVHCAAEGCDVVIGRGKIFCQGHYFSLPKALRSDLWDTWRAAMNGRYRAITVEEHARLNRAYQEAYQACQEHLRTVRATPAQAMTTVAIAADGRRVTYANGRLL